MGSRRNTTRCTEKVYAYAGRDAFYQALVNAGFTHKTSRAISTGIVNERGTAFKRARELWCQYMGGKPFPMTGEEYANTIKTETPRTANMLLEEMFNKKPNPEPQKAEESIKEGTKEDNGLALQHKLDLISQVLAIRSDDPSVKDKTLALIQTITKM